MITFLSIELIKMYLSTTAFTAHLLDIFNDLFFLNGIFTFYMYLFNPFVPNKLIIPLSRKAYQCVK